MFFKSPSAISLKPTARSERSSICSGAISSSRRRYASPSGTGKPSTWASIWRRVRRRRLRTSRNNTRYGSWVGPVAASSSSLAAFMDRSASRFSTSRRYKSAAIQRASNSTSRVTGAVTLGLPSRSPPIHEASFTGAQSAGGAGRPCSANCASSRRNTSGTACHRDCSMVAKPHLASSTGVGFSRRISSVHQAARITRRSRSRRSSRSSSLRSERSSSLSRSAIWSYLRIRVRRVTSVGCAVSTSSTERSSSVPEICCWAIWFSARRCNTSCSP